MKWILVLWGLAFTAQASFAYAPPPSFILEKMIQSRKSLKTLEMTGVVTNLRDFSKFEETVRIDFLSARLESLYRQDEQVVGTHADLFEGLRALGEVWLEFSMDPDSSRVGNVLSGLGGAPDASQQTKITRNQRQVVWTWESEAKVEILKDQFALAFFRSVSGLEFLVESLTMATTEFSIPKVIRIKRLGQDLFLYELKKHQLNPPIQLKTKGYPKLKVSDPVIQEWVELVR